MFERFDEIFRSCGWRVVELRYGKRLRGRARRASQAASAGSRACPTPTCRRSITRAARRGGRGSRPTSASRPPRSSRQHDDAALAALFTDLGGHCMESLVEAFDAAQDDVPTLFIAWTIKGYGLPFAGHKDNHAGLMNPTQMAALREAMGVARGAGMGAARRRRRQCPAGRRGADREQPDRAREAAARVRQGSRCRRSPPRPATSNRPRRRSAASCSTCPRPAAISPTASSPPRPTSPSRPTSAPGSTSAACSGASEMADVFAQGKDCIGAKMVRRQQGPAYRAGHRREQPFPDARRGRALPATCSGSGCSRSERSTTRSSPAASMRSTTPATRTRASCSSRRRAGSRSAPKAAPTSRSTRR